MPLVFAPFLIDLWNQMLLKSLRKWLQLVVVFVFVNICKKHKSYGLSRMWKICPRKGAGDKETDIFFTLVLVLLWRLCKIRTAFKTLISKTARTWWLKKNFRVASFGKTFKTFVKKNLTNKIQTGEKYFCRSYIWRFVNRFFSDKVIKLEVYFGLHVLVCISGEGKIK